MRCDHEWREAAERVLSPHGCTMGPIMTGVGKHNYFLVIGPDNECLGRIDLPRGSRGDPKPLAKRIGAQARRLLRKMEKAA